jgi:hypothetical protein
LPCAISSVVCEKIPDNLEVLLIIPEIVVRGILNHDRMTERGRDRGARLGGGSELSAWTAWIYTISWIAL